MRVRRRGSSRLPFDTGAPLGRSWVRCTARPGDWPARPARSSRRFPAPLVAYRAAPRAAPTTPTVRCRPERRRCRRARGRRCRTTVEAIFDLDQLRRDPNSITGLPHAALEQRGDAQLVADVTKVLVLALERKRGRASRHLE